MKQGVTVQKLLLMSMLLATLTVPAVWPARGQAVHGRLAALFLGLVGVWVFLLLVVYPRLF